MTKHCYHCAIKNICTVYNVLVKYSKDISFSLNSCKYMTLVQRNNKAQFANPITLAEKTEKIRELSSNVHDRDAPQTTKAAMAANMRFEVDDVEIS